MVLAARDKIFAHYHQIAIGDAGIGAVPQWESGDETVVVSAHTVLVATAPDEMVSCRIWLGEAAPLWGAIVFDGELSFDSGRIQVGSILGDHVITSEVTPGVHRVLVRAYPEEAISIIDAFVFTSVVG